MALGTELALAFVIIAVLMLLAEAASPGSFILVPATVLLVLGILGLLYEDWLLTWYAPLTAVIILIPMTALTIKLYQKLAPPEPPQTTVGSSLVGMKGMVEREVIPHSMKGKVRIANDTWSATAETNIPAGTRVVVKSSAGVHVVVEELPEGGP